MTPDLLPDAPLSPDDRALIARFYAGACTPQELSRAEELLARHPRALEFRRVLERELAPGSRTWSSADIQHAFAEWRRYQDAIASVRPTASNAPSRGTRRTQAPLVSQSVRRNRLWSMVGASAVLLVLVGGFILRQTTSPNDNASRTYTTTAGQRSSVTLADGSRMILAPATTAKVSPEMIRLTGEAYFQVVPDAHRAITIQTSDASVSVLGTSFVVRHYPDEPTSRVVVEDGRVAVRPGAGSNSRLAPAILTAGMLGRLTDSTVAITPGVPVRDYTAWTTGRLVFDSLPLREVVRELSRAYAADVRVTDATLERQPVTLSAHVETDPLRQVLDFLARTVDAHVEQRDGAFVIRPGLPPKRAVERAPRPSLIPLPEKQYGR